MKGIEKQESIGSGMNEMKKSRQLQSRQQSFQTRGDLEKEAEAEIAQSSTMMSLAAMENERKELMVRWLANIYIHHLSHTSSSTN